jgi:tetratricopeptide (TPR) repeat protein
MNWGPVLLCSWPGLPGLWYRGQASSLFVAAGFSVLFNLALVSTFLWPWFFGETFLLVTWPILLLFWTSSACMTYKSLPDLMSVSPIPSPPQDSSSIPNDTLFIQAQSEYLKGHWPEAESLLRRNLQTSPRDIEARLLLATLLRHSRRLDDASEELENLLKYDQSINWISEIRREQKLIDLIFEHEIEPEVQSSEPIDTLELRSLES